MRTSRRRRHLLFQHVPKGAYTMARGPVSRSGNVNTSRGQARPSSDNVATSSAANGHNDGDDGHQDSLQDMALRVKKVLQDFEKQHHPLTSEVCDPVIRTSINNWVPMSTHIDNALYLINDVAVGRADALDQTDDAGEDARLKRMDGLFRDILDIHEATKLRKKALEEIRETVRRGEVSDATEQYRDAVERHEVEYKKKTKRQKYASSKKYEDFQGKIWEAMHEEDDPMPPMAELIAAEEGDEEESSDEIAVFGNQAFKYRCPMLLVTMTDPLKSTVCTHAFDRNSILEFLGAATKSCPGGCGIRLSKNNLVEDAEFTRACQQYARRQQRRKDRDRTQAEGTMLD